MKQYKEVNIIVYKDVDGMSRIEYKDHIIQTYDAMLNEHGNLCHFIIDKYGNDIGEEWCLLEAILKIDKLSRGINQ